MDENLALAVNQWINGNEEGFNTIYNETYNYVFAKTRAIMKNYDDAADLLQEVYIAASKSLSTLSDPNNLYAWLGGIAYRQGMKIFNKQRDVLVSDEGEGLFEVQECLDKSVQPGVEMEERETADIIKDMLDELPPEQSAVVVAYYYDEMSVTDIAETLGVSTGTIKSRLNYARKKLQELVLAKEEREGIRLHSVTIPTIIIAVHMYMEGFALDVADAQIVYNGIATKMGYASVVGSQGVGEAYTFDNASNMSSLGSNITNHGGISGAASGSSGMSAAVTSASVSSTVGTSIIKSIAIMIIIIISSTSGVVIGKKAYQKYHDKIEYSSSSSAQRDDTSSANNESNNSQGDNSSGDAASNDALGDEDPQKQYEDAFKDVIDNLSDMGETYLEQIKSYSDCPYDVEEVFTDFEVYYSYYDFNGDEIPEIVVGARSADKNGGYRTTSSSMDICGIYALVDNKPEMIEDFTKDNGPGAIWEKGYSDSHGVYRILANGETKETDDRTEDKPVSYLEWSNSDGISIPEYRDGGRVVDLPTYYQAEPVYKIDGSTFILLIDGMDEDGEPHRVNDKYELDEHFVQRSGAMRGNTYEYSEESDASSVGLAYGGNGGGCLYLDKDGRAYRMDLWNMGYGW